MKRNPTFGLQVATPDLYSRAGYLGKLLWNKRSSSPPIKLERDYYGDYGLSFDWLHTQYQRVFRFPIVFEQGYDTGKHDIRSGSEYAGRILHNLYWFIASKLNDKSGVQLRVRFLFHDTDNSGVYIAFYHSDNRIHKLLLGL